MTRTRIKTDEHGAVLLTAEDGWGETVTRRFYVRSAEQPGYVRQGDGDPSDPQVCEMLSSRGQTLHCSRAALLVVVRREWSRARRWRQQQERLSG